MIKPWPMQVVQTARAWPLRMSTPRLSCSTWGCCPTPPKITAGAQRQVFAVGLKVFLDLQGQLPGRGQNQRADGPASPAPARSC